MPISVSTPTKEDLASTERLLQTLKDEGLFETEEESRRRYILFPVVPLLNWDCRHAICFLDQRLASNNNFYCFGKFHFFRIEKSCLES